MNGHEKYFDLLYEYASGELDAALNREIEEHLSVCQDCRSQFLLIEKIRDGIKDAAYECEYDIPGAVMERIRKDRENKRKFRMKAIGTLGTAAAFIIIAAMYIWQGGRFDPNYYYYPETGAASGQSEQADMAPEGEELSLKASQDDAVLYKSGTDEENDPARADTASPADGDGRATAGRPTASQMIAATERNTEEIGFGIQNPDGVSALAIESEGMAGDPEMLNRAVVENRKSVYALDGYLSSDLLVKAEEVQNISELVADCGGMGEQDASDGYLLLPGDCYEVLLAAFVENGIPVYYGNYVENAEYTIVFIESK